MATTNMRIVIRRDTKDNWTNVGTSVILLAGEQGYETDTGRMKIGNGKDEWNKLPYYAGGITAIDNDTIIMDASGKIMLNSDSVIGDLGSADTIKEYVDAKDDALAQSIANEAAARAAADSVEAAARQAADEALGERIDEEIVNRINGDTALGALIDNLAEDVDDSINNVLDFITVETTARGSADEILSNRIDDNFAVVSDSIEALDIKLDNVKNESNAADVAINLRIDSLEGALSDSVTVLEEQLAAKADLDSVAAVLRDVDSYVGNYQGGATISDDLVTLAQYNDTQDSNLDQLTTVVNNLDTRVDDIVAGDIPFTGSLTAPGFNGDLAGNAATASAAKVGDDLDLRIEALENSTALQDSVDALIAYDMAQDSDAATEYANIRQELAAGDTAVAAAASDELATAISDLQDADSDLAASVGTALDSKLNNSGAETIDGSLYAVGGFSGDGSGLTGITAGTATTASGVSLTVADPNIVTGNEVDGQFLVWNGQAYIFFTGAWNQIT